MNPEQVSIILPARNEANNLKKLLPRLKAVMPGAEILVVDDGSDDDTLDVCAQHSVRAIHHPYSVGNGGAIKSGARAASNEILMFMDADGQHSPEDIPVILEKLDEGFDMVVGSRTHRSQANVGRSLANVFYNRLASWITGHRVQDLTSGFRAIRTSKFKEFIHLLPNGFSYPTTITMAFFRVGHLVGYLPIQVHKRAGKSHIRLVRDGARFLLIIFRVGTFYSPLKIFFPISITLWLLGISYYAYTYILEERFTNMSALMLTSSLTIFLIGLVSEQITYLIYSKSKE